MANFSHYLPLLLRFEGGYVNDPDDPGGATNKGITLKTFQALGPELGIRDTSLEALKRLGDADVARLYKRHYWDALQADTLTLQPLAEMLVDFYVNAGGTAVRELQRELNAGGKRQPPLREDGVFGADTAQALREADALATYRGLRQRRIGYYERLAKANPKLRKFLRGWLNRVAAFPVL